MADSTRIATYNVWNENKGIGDRIAQILNEIEKANADVIALQEITPWFYSERLALLKSYPYSKYGKYTNEEEGLAILSKYPFIGSTFLHLDDSYANSCALNVLIDIGNAKISLTNVHLPWDSIRVKEEQIVAIDKFMHEQTPFADYSIVLGDFNCGINSSVHRFMLGEQTINGNEARPYWYEVSSVYAAVNCKELLPTLDCINNPGLKGKAASYAPENFDRIYVMDVRNGYQFNDVKLFGTEISDFNNLCASDHYGVMADINFLK